MDVAKVKLDNSVIKLIMYVIIVLAIIYYINRFVSGSKDAISSVLGQSKEEKAEIAKSAVEGVKNASITKFDGGVSYKRETFVNLAQKLQDANARLLFDSQAVKDVFSLMRTVADVKFLIQVYGIKNGMNMLQYLRKIIPRSNYIGLSINDLNEILRKKGVRYAL